MSDAESSGNPTLTPDTQADDFEAVEVFPDSTDMDPRPDTGNYYRYTVCDVSCPVAETDGEFPGSKFQGPEQWWLERKEGEAVDDSIMSRSNCTHYDDACPSGILLGQMHNTACGEYADEQMNKLSWEYTRNHILANYGTLAQLGNMFPRLANAVMSNSVVQRINEKVFGITAKHDFPEFATQMFREWWSERGDPQVRSNEKHVAYFHGCCSSYNTPKVGKAVVRVFESSDYEVVIPKQRCSGTPMFADRTLDDAKRAVGINADNSAGFIPEGYNIVASCAFCSMSPCQEYPELFGIDGIEDLLVYTYEALEYFRTHEDLEGAVREASTNDQTFTCHASCHGHNQGLDQQAIELFCQLDDVEVESMGDFYSGTSSTYGWKEERYDRSTQIDADMFDYMKHAQGSVGMAKCPTCSTQMEHGTGYGIRHPLQLLERALV